MATTDTWDSPALDQPINADLPAIKNKFQALVKGDPSLVQDPPVGAKRLVEIDSGNWQARELRLPHRRAPTSVCRQLLMPAQLQHTALGMRRNMVT